LRYGGALIQGETMADTPEHNKPPSMALPPYTYGSAGLPFYHEWYCPGCGAAGLLDDVENPANDWWDWKCPECGTDCRRA